MIRACSARALEWFCGFKHLCRVGNNEIDTPLLDLLTQNIAAARAAGQEQPALFMEKVRDAAKKFVLSK